MFAAVWQAIADEDLVPVYRTKADREARIDGVAHCHFRHLWCFGSVWSYLPSKKLGLCPTDDNMMADDGVYNIYLQPSRGYGKCV